MNLRRSLSLVAILVLIGGAALSAHPGHDHKLMGTIASIAGNRVVVKTNEGPEKAVEITSATKLLRGKKRGTITELKVGMRVVVNVGTGAEPLRAKEVLYPDAPTTASRN